MSSSCFLLSFVSLPSERPALLFVDSVFMEVIFPFFFPPQPCHSNATRAVKGCAAARFEIMGVRRRTQMEASDVVCVCEFTGIWADGLRQAAITLMTTWEDLITCTVPGSYFGLTLVSYTHILVPDGG